MDSDCEDNGQKRSQSSDDGSDEKSLLQLGSSSSFEGSEEILLEQPRTSTSKEASSAVPSTSMGLDVALDVDPEPAQVDLNKDDEMDQQTSSESENEDDLDEEAGRWRRRLESKSQFPAHFRRALRKELRRQQREGMPEGPEVEDGPREGRVVVRGQTVLFLPSTLDRQTRQPPGGAAGPRQTQARVPGRGRRARRRENGSLQGTTSGGSERTGRPTSRPNDAGTTSHRRGLQGPSSPGIQLRQRSPYAEGQGQFRRPTLDDLLENADCDWDVDSSPESYRNAPQPPPLFSVAGQSSPAENFGQIDALGSNWNPNHYHEDGRPKINVYLKRKSGPSRGDPGQELPQQQSQQEAAQWLGIIRKEIL